MQAIEREDALSKASKKEAKAKKEAAPAPEPTKTAAVEHGEETSKKSAGFGSFF